MEQAISTLSPAALAGLLVAYLMAASRIAGPLAPLWARLPAPWPQLAPAIMALLPQIADAFKDVNTWQSFAVSVATAIGLALPGTTAKPAVPKTPEEVLAEADKTRRINPPTGPLLVLLLAGALALSQQACNRDARPCSAEDLASGPMAEHDAKCAAERQLRFPDMSDDDCMLKPGCAELVAECDRWNEERCK